MFVALFPGPTPHILNRLMMACLQSNFEVNWDQLRDYLPRDQLHEINSHETNSHKINSHEINFPRDQHQ